MIRKRFTKSVSMLMSAVLLFSLLAIQAFADRQVTWQPSVDGVYDATQPGTILVYKNELSDGGMDLSKNSMTGAKASADIAYYSGTIGARDIIDLGAVDFDSEDTIPDSGYSTELKATAGHVYIVSTHQGSFAKIKIKSVMASSVYITYAIYKEDQPTGSSSGSGGSTGSGGGADTSGDWKLDKFDDISSSADIVEGNWVSLTWEPVTANARESYDIYRSDNGADYELVTESSLTKRQYVDKDLTAGHYYLYRIIAYDSNDSFIQAYPLLKAKIVKKQTNSITLQIGSSKVNVNGTVKTLSGSPSLINKKVFLPSGYYTSLLGAKVVWDAKAKTATVTYGSTTAVLKLNSTAASVNNRKVTLDAPFQTVKGTMMIPASLISSAFNLKVSYTASKGTIVITGGESNANTPAADPSGTGSTSGAGSLDYAYKTFILWVPGASYVTSNYDGSINTLYVSPGTQPKSTITVNKNGTYVWNSDWDGKTIKGKWTSNGDGTLNLINGQEGKNWKLEQSNGKNEDIYILDGYSWYSGKAVTVKSK